MNVLQELITAQPGEFGEAVVVAAALARVPIAGVALVENGGLRLYDTVNLPVDQQAELLPLCRQTVDADDLVVFARPRRSAGRMVHFYAGVPVRADDRRPVGAVFVAAHDVSHQDGFVLDVLWAVGNQVERRLDAMRADQEAELLDRVATTAHGAADLRVALRCCLDEVCAHAGWPIGHACLPAHDGTGELVSAGVWHGAGNDRLRDIIASTRVSATVGLPGEAAAAMSPQWREQLAVPGIGVRSGFAFPVRADHGLVAVLEFFDDRPRPPSPRLIGLATRLGHELGRAASRIADRATLRNAIRFAPDVFVALDAGGLVTEWNRAAERMFGRSREDVLAKPLDVEPEDLLLAGLDPALVDVLTDALRRTPPAGSAVIRLRRTRTEARITLAYSGIDTPDVPLVVAGRGGRFRVASRAGDGATMVHVAVPVPGDGDQQP